MAKHNIPGLKEAAAYAQHLYRSAEGQWVGCDWPTGSEQWPEDLEGMSSATAWEEAGAADTLAAREAWEAAAEWLEAVEDSAAYAQDQAEKAVAALRRGDLDAAMIHAREASNAESEYGDDPTWGLLFRHIRGFVERR